MTQSTAKTGSIAANIACSLVRAITTRDQTKSLDSFMSTFTSFIPELATESSDTRKLLLAVAVLSTFSGNPVALSAILKPILIGQMARVIPLMIEALEQAEKNSDSKVLSTLVALLTYGEPAQGSQSTIKILSILKVPTKGSKSSNNDADLVKIIQMLTGSTPAPEPRRTRFLGALSRLSDKSGPVASTSLLSMAMPALTGSWRAFIHWLCAILRVTGKVDTPQSVSCFIARPE